MKGCPTPGIARSPIPATVGIDPMSVVAIGLPASVVSNDRWPPAPAVTGHVHPSAIRCQRVIKIIHRDVSRRCRRGFGCVSRRRCRALRGILRLCREYVCRHTRLLQLLVALHHGIGDFRRCAKIVQVNNFIRIEAERAGGVADVSQDDALLDTSLHQPDDLCERAVGINVRRQRAGSGRIVRGSGGDEIGAAGPGNSCCCC